MDRRCIAIPRGCVGETRKIRVSDGIDQVLFIQQRHPTELVKYDHHDGHRIAGPGGPEF
jgi:hypothetical protein